MYEAQLNTSIELAEHVARLEDERKQLGDALIKISIMKTSDNIADAIEIARAAFKADVIWPST
jgi:hypothetical protein